MSVSTYDPQPTIGAASRAWRGWAAVRSVLADIDVAVVALEAYPGVDEEELAAEAAATWPDRVLIRTSDAFPDPETQAERLETFLTDDRVFGRMFFGTVADLMDAQRLARLRASADAAKAAGRNLVVVGLGATLVAAADTVVVCDLTRWEIQLRMRRKEIGNHRADNLDEDILRKYKRGFFVEWRAADRLKSEILPACDWYLDCTCAGEPRLVSGDDYRAALASTVERPFRLVPYFDAGVWGGHWMQDNLGVQAPEGQLAWCFDGVPEENSLRYAMRDAEGGEVIVQTPAMNLVLTEPESLLGPEVFARFGAEFPIRFDFLDTIGGQNLSLQVHPTTEYIHRTFGMAYTQDESYYILDAGPDAGVYLGLRSGVDRTELLDALEAAKDPSSPLDAERYVNRFPARKHDHFLIPAGTIHCSAADTMVLEISATPYIFTFKLWDWARLGMDGLPRPIHTEHGRHVIDWRRDTAWVEANLLPRNQVVQQWEDGVVEATGLHELEFIETWRYTLRGECAVESQDRFSMLNVVEGDAVEVFSPTGGFDPFVVHFAETFIVPAAAGKFGLRPAGNAEEVKVLRAFVRPQRQG